MDPNDVLNRKLNIFTNFSQIMSGVRETDYMFFLIYWFSCIMPSFSVSLLLSPFSAKIAMTHIVFRGDPMNDSTFYIRTMVHFINCTF